MLQKWFEETNSNFWDQNPRQRDLEDLGNSSERLPYQLWNVNKYGSCADAAITGVMPPPLMESQVTIGLLNSIYSRIVWLKCMPVCLVSTVTMKNVVVVMPCFLLTSCTCNDISSSLPTK